MINTKHKKNVSKDVHNNKGNNRLERYRVPNKLIYELFENKF